jgi:hypothetical protein
LVVSDLVDVTSVVDAGRKAQRGRVSGDRNSGRTSTDTLKANCQHHCEVLARKVMGGGAVKAVPRCSETTLRG